MNINDAFPSKWLKANDIPHDTVMVMDHVEMETIQAGEKQKAVLYFQNIEKGMVLNTVNKNTIVGMYGPETNGWTGKPITLFATEVDFAGEQVLAIRVRMRKPDNGVNGAEVARQELLRWKSEAWKMWQSKHADVTDQATQLDNFKRKVMGYFNGRPLEQLGAAQWQEVVAAEFEKSVDNPIAETGGVPADQIPF